ncbi:hypothetical protein HJG60_008136 [Phyllostomus discolor]|uniref:Uncharacterized protein n=1 Tax=Phyllostomus discolor TaxID=89673 RepID=A0A833ZAU1_9CHIR|nr:hypothetical protein HJG60_008136 [Phyllostomus discolor]
MRRSQDDPATDLIIYVIHSICIYIYIYTHVCAGVGKSRFTVVHMQNTTIINKQQHKNKLGLPYGSKHYLHPPRTYVCMHTHLTYMLKHTHSNICANIHLFSYVYMCVFVCVCICTSINLGFY